MQHIPFYCQRIPIQIQICTYYQIAVIYSIFCQFSWRIYNCLCCSFSTAFTISTTGGTAGCSFRILICCYFCRGFSSNFSCTFCCRFIVFYLNRHFICTDQYFLHYHCRIRRTQNTVTVNIRYVHIIVFGVFDGHCVIVSQYFLQNDWSIIGCNNSVCTGISINAVIICFNTIIFCRKNKGVLRKHK